MVRRHAHWLLWHRPAAGLVDADRIDKAGRWGRHDAAAAMSAGHDCYYPHRNYADRNCWRGRSYSLTLLGDVCRRRKVGRTEGRYSGQLKAFHRAEPGSYKVPLRGRGDFI